MSNTVRYFTKVDLKTGARTTELFNEWHAGEARAEFNNGIELSAALKIVNRWNNRTANHRCAFIYFINHA